MGVTDTQSFSLVIRDIFFDALARDTFFADYTKRKTRMLAVMPNHLPYLGVYIIDETMMPDGDANATAIRFSHTLRIGFSVMIANNDQEVAEKTIDSAFWRIMHDFWEDPYIMNVIDTYNPHLGFGNPDNTMIESISRGMRRHVFGAQMVNNETPIAEMQYDLSVFYRTEWSPGPFDDFKELHLRTGIKIGETQTQMDQRVQAGADLVFETATTQAKPNNRRSKDNG
jgi:hypothetical protein